MRPIGSEKLPVDKKIQRIIDIANYSSTKTPVNESKCEYSLVAANNRTYGIVRKNSTYIIQEGKDVNSLNPINGLENSKPYTFNSYGAALKKLNLIIKETNQRVGNDKGQQLFGEQEKFVLKTPEPEAEPEEDFGFEADEEGEEGGFDFDAEEGGEDVDFGGEEGGEEEVNIDVEAEGGPEPTKAIQKLTGKLGQKLREFKDDLDPDTIKYVINSILSAVDLTQLSAEDIEDIQEKLEKDEELDYSEEGEFDVEVTGDEEMDLDVEDTDDAGGDDLDLELAEEEDLEEFWPAVRAAAGAALGDWAVKKGTEAMGLDEEEGLDVELSATDEDPYGEDEELKAKFMSIFEESKADKTIKKYFRKGKKEKEYNKVITESFLKDKVKKAKEGKKLSKYYVSYEQETSSKKLMETYNVNFLGRTRKGDLLFQKGKIKVGVTPGGEIIS